MNIQFIVCGWWYDEFDGRKGITDFIDGLIELQKDNEFIDVFWSCHREPTDIVKENFNWKLFENIGLEEGAYTQALEYLDVDDEVNLPARFIQKIRVNNVINIFDDVLKKIN